jgi:hypothetical protein
MTNYSDFLTKVIDIGNKAARRDYARPDQRFKLDGSITGFTECRDKMPAALAQLLVESRESAIAARDRQLQNYWYWRCRDSEFEWVCNVVGAMLMKEGLAVIVQPTARGVLMADLVLRMSETA